MLTAACATVRPVQIPGLEEVTAHCSDEPAVLSDADVAALVEAMPSAEQRERAFWAPRDQAHRKCTMHERARADGAVNAGRRFNETVRNAN
jgi:hypothetical protein